MNALVRFAVVAALRIARAYSRATVLDAHRRRQRLAR